MNGLRLAIGTLSVFPVRPPLRVDARTAGAAMTWAPPVGLALGAVAGAVGWLAYRLELGLAAPVLAIATLAVLTRGLHLDGLADTADGLGSGRRGLDGVAVMKAPDIGPFGVTTLIFVVLLQVTAMGAIGPGAVLTSLAIAAATGRLAVTMACGAGIQAAQRDGLGAMVAGTVARSQLAVPAGGTVAAALALRWDAPYLAVAALLAGLAASYLLLRHCVRRFGGITGDILGALVETATTVALLTLATA